MSVKNWNRTSETLTNLLITGLPQCGKTTLIKKILLDPSVQNRAGGFITEEFRKEGVRSGFMVTTIPAGKTALLAQKKFPSPHRVGSYGVLLKNLENSGCRAIQEALDSGKFVIVDEIGKMELFSREFQRLILEALDSPIKFLATIMERPSTFADQVKNRTDVRVMRLTKKNFDRVFSDVQKWVRSEEP